MGIIKNDNPFIGTELKLNIHIEPIGDTTMDDYNFDIVYQDNTYYYKQTGVEYAKFNYGGIIDALISHKYPNDKMQAVINNYLLEPENEEFVTAFNEMQSWRKEAKEIAKEALLYELS